MDNDYINTNENETAEQAQPQTPRQRVAMAVVAFVITLIGWCLLPFTYIASIACAVVGIVTGIIGWRGPHGGWRNLAITATVMAGTLLLVFVASWAVFAYIESAL